jgi:hypothetical protein
MKTTSLVISTTALIAAAFGTRTASANLITNGSLELTTPTVTAPNNFLIVQASVSSADTTTLPGWTITGSVDVIPSSYWQATAGLDSVDMIGSPGLGSLSQTVTGLTPGALYGITFDFAVNPSLYQGENTDTKFLQLTVISSSFVHDGSQVYSGSAGSATRTNMGYVSEFLSFTASTSIENINFSALVPANLPNGVTAATAACGPVIDNVDLEYLSGSGTPSGSAPEPASLGLLAAGSMLLFRRRSTRAI